MISVVSYDFSTCSAVSDMNIPCIETRRYIAMQLVTIKELSGFLKVKESTLYSWVHGGSMPFYKLNGLLRFDMDEILEWVKNSKAVPAPVLAPINRPETQDIDSLIKKAIEGVKGKGYNPSKRETSLNQGLRKEVSDGTV